MRQRGLILRAKHYVSPVKKSKPGVLKSKTFGSYAATVTIVTNFVKSLLA